MSILRRLGRRTAWLMAGAAIGLAVVYLVAALMMVVAAIVTGLPLAGGEPSPSVLVLGLVLALVLGAALGLVPGVRELEVTGARAMLEARGELLVPDPPRAGHRLRTVGFVLVHLLLGLGTVALLGMVLPLGVATVIDAVTASTTGAGIALPGGGAGRALGLVLGTALAVLGLGGAWPLGLLAARTAPRLLGPTPGDRLAAAQARADREAEHRRLARDLHDGIGHALTAIGVQATAARRVGDRDPEAVTAALAAIESTAREATAELDGVLALLREEQEAPSSTSPPPARSLAQLIEGHRRSGMTLRTDLDLPDELPPLAARHLERILAELLANARRHGAPGPVDVTVASDPERGELHLEVRSPRDPGTPPTRRRGHGLPGLRERAALLGGTLEAGPEDDGRRWCARARLPLFTPVRPDAAGPDRRSPS